ncbi:histone-lysine N-methyltransferase SMYD3-like [Drosophila grimshawi]|nr:histone-lysine N-methyltransferase SMYD3 [Drosophila grimshawi]XP_043072134.1 histone-lysine N-methyltransferase SMYD3-like [Drosophila grimshawi]XP_043072135.1 histone-lysine N-methyltransferase SMYD3-like [Drosophila grimshawi]
MLQAVVAMESLPTSLTTKESKECLTIKRGTRILSEKPFAYVLKSQYRLERCDNCLEAVQKVRKCSNCRYVSYCNRTCQQQAWPLHKHECPFLKRVQPRIVPDAARMLCRLILRLEHGGDLERGYYTEHGSRKFRDLMSHYAEIKNDPKRREHLESLHAVLTDMISDSNSGSSSIVPNITELMSIYGRLITNGFNILDAEMNSIATAIYLGVSITDHSCQPNAVATFEGNELHVHVIEDLPCLDWSKIYISYIDLLNTPEQRRADLREHYYFLCVCSKCIDPQEMHEMTAAVCPNASCDASVNIELAKCQQCDASVTPQLRTAYNDIMAFTQSSLDSMKEVAYLDVCNVCLEKQRGVLHPLNVWHVKTLDAAFEAAINVGKWTDALAFGQQLLPGFGKYHGAWNPLVGLLHMKLGKIQLYERNYKLAVHHLQEAQRILSVTHGHDHRLLVDQLRPLMLQARHEMT